MTRNRARDTTDLSLVLASFERERHLPLLLEADDAVEIWTSTIPRTWVLVPHGSKDP